ncbi:MAG: acyl carrier protein [Chloroflexota bacterium]
MKPTLEAIKTIVKLQLGLPDVSAEADLFGELALESVDLLNIIAVIEENYDVDIEEEAIVTVTTVRDIYELTIATYRDS